MQSYKLNLGVYKLKEPMWIKIVILTNNGIGTKANFKILLKMVILHSFFGKNYWPSTNVIDYNDCVDGNRENSKIGTMLSKKRKNGYVKNRFTGSEWFFYLPFRIFHGIDGSVSSISFPHLKLIAHQTIKAPFVIGAFIVFSYLFQGLFY